MSVVLAVKNKDKIILATDSQVSYGGTKRLITNPNSYKIWRPAGHQHLIVGGVGALRDLNILSTVDVWFDEYVTVGSKVEDFELTFSYVVRTLGPALRREIADFVGDLEDFNSYLSTSAASTTSNTGSFVNPFSSLISFSLFSNSSLIKKSRISSQ